MDTRTPVSRVVTARRRAVLKNTASVMGQGINVVSTASVKTVPIVDLYNINFVVSKSTSIRLI